METYIKPNIFYITPFASDMKYGEQLNKHIELLPEDAWIVVRDTDTMILTPNSGNLIEQSIIDNPDVHLMTARTNRIWGHKLDDDPNILNHHKKATQLESREKSYTEIKGVVPAFCWIFPKSTWNNNKFDSLPIIHRGNSMDARWTRQIKGKKIRLDHLYIFHFYRLNKHFRDYKHLV